MSIITNGTDVAVYRLRKSGYILYQTILSVVLGIVLFVLCALIVLAADAKGLIKAVNSLLGASLGTITAGKLIILSAVLAVVACVGRIIIHACLAFIKDAALMMSGGVVVAATPAPGETPVPPPPVNRRPRTASSASAGNDAVSAGGRFTLDSDPVEGAVTMPPSSD